MYVIKNYCTGEIWEIEDVVMKESGYFYRRILEELKWVAHKEPEYLQDDGWAYAEILYRDEYGSERHIGAVYYCRSENYNVTAWYNWHDEKPYCHSCFKYSDK